MINSQFWQVYYYFRNFSNYGSLFTIKPARFIWTLIFLPIWILTVTKYI